MGLTNLKETGLGTLEKSSKDALIISGLFGLAAAVISAGAIIYSNRDKTTVPPVNGNGLVLPPSEPEEEMPAECRELSPGLWQCEYVFKGTWVREWTWDLKIPLECLSLQGMMVCGFQSLLGNIVKINVHDVLLNKWRTVFYKDGAKGTFPFSASVGMKVDIIKFIIEPDLWTRQGYLDDVQVSGTFLKE